MRKRRRYRPNRIKQIPETENQSKNYFENIWDDESKKVIRKIIQDIVDVFQKNDEIIFLFYGSLLGCARNGQIIPWDGDVDFFIEYGSSKKSIDELKKLGYSVCGSINKRVYVEERDKNRRGWTWPWVDIYSYKILDKNINFMSDEKNIFYSCKTNEVFPLENEKFEGINVPIPNMMHKHLDSIYPDWQNVYENCKVEHKSLDRRKKIVRVNIKDFDESR